MNTPPSLPRAPRPVPVAAPPAQGTLALEFLLPSGLPAVPAPPELTLVVGGDADAHPDTGPADPPPAAREWAGRFVQAVVEVVSGDRPVQQLIRWTDERVYADLTRRVRILGLTTSAAVRHRVERSQVRSIHICQPQPGVAEVAAHVRHGPRSRAVAARLEAGRARWTCTALQLG